MLVLTRGVDQTIRIGENITIMVIGLKSGGVRLGITAPKDVPVHREEIFQSLKREQAESHRPR